MYIYIRLCIIYCQINAIETIISSSRFDEFMLADRSIIRILFRLTRVSIVVRVSDFYTISLDIFKIVRFSF